MHKILSATQDCGNYGRPIITAAHLKNSLVIVTAPQFLDACGRFGVDVNKVIRANVDIVAHIDPPEEVYGAVRGALIGEIETYLSGDLDFRNGWYKWALNSAQTKFHDQYQYMGSLDLADDSAISERHRLDKKASAYACLLHLCPNPYTVCDGVRRLGAIWFDTVAKIALRDELVGAGVIWTSIVDAGLRTEDVVSAFDRMYPNGL